jgi:hypothetical protein
MMLPLEKTTHKATLKPIAKESPHSFITDDSSTNS